MNSADKLAQAKRFLAERGKGTVKRLTGPQPKVKCHTFYAKMPTSYRQATGHDLKTMDERKWERWAEKAYRLVLA